MILICKNKSLKLSIDDNLLNQLEELGLEHYPNEFGGFLLGKYSGDFRTLYITKLMLPKKYIGFPLFFERSIIGLKHKFHELFQREKIYYVGEWHTHPNGSSHYSQTDLKAMKEIAECKTVQINNPILLILSITKKGCNGATFYYYDNTNLFTYE